MGQVLVVLVVLLAARVAAARPRVVLLGVDGRGGAQVRDLVEEALTPTVTVVSERLFRTRQQRLHVRKLDAAGYARVALDLAADAVVSGVWTRDGARHRLRLTVRAGRTGAIAQQVDVRIAALDDGARDAIAAALGPVIAAIPPVDGPIADDDAAGSNDDDDDNDNDDRGPDRASDGRQPDGEAARTAPGPGASDDDHPRTPGDAGAATDTPSSDVSSFGTSSFGGATADAATASPDAAAQPTDTEGSTEPEGDTGLGPISGKTLAYVRAPVDGGDFQQVSTSLWLSAHPRVSDTTSAHVETAIDALEVSATGATGVRLTVRDAYVAFKRRGWLVRAGRQIIPWGASDAINPTDFLTARDFRVFAVDSEATRVGATSAMVARATAHTEATVVVTPFAPMSTILVPADAVPAGLTVAPPATIAPTLADTELAAKLRLSGTGWDLAVLGFRGWNHTPEFEVVSADDTGIVVRQTHHRVTAAGIDGSATLGKLVFRLEGAFVQTANPDGSDPTIQPSHLFAVVGVERPLGQRLRVQAQLAARDHLQWTAPADATGPDPATTAARQAVAGANALLLDYQDQVRATATVRIAYTSADETLEAEVFAAVNLDGNDYLVRPLLTWHPHELVSLQVGFDGYGGHIDRPLGALHGFRGAFAQAAYSF